MDSSHRSYRIHKQGLGQHLQRSTEPAAQTPGPHQVLIRMEAASLNYRDLLSLQDSASRDGLHPLSDGVGRVVAVGAEVSAWRVGDRVSPNFFPDWVAGRFRMAYLGRALGGAQTDGVLRDFMLIEDRALVAVPSYLSAVEAATLPCAALTAWHALFERKPLQAGETVLVQGTGGVALWALQLATAAGAKVIVTSSSDEKLARARALGAWQTVNYRETPDWDRAAIELNGGQGIDHILELGGPDTYARSVHAVGAGGRIAQIGVLSGFAAQADIRSLQFKNASIDGICVGSVEQFERMNRFLVAHQLHPVIDRSFAFDEAEAAYAQLRSAQHFGKLVLAFD